MSEHQDRSGVAPPLPTLNLKDLERLAILQAVRQEPERNRAAKTLGVSRYSLLRRIKRLGLGPELT